MDVGPSTVASVSESDARLDLFCAGLEWDKKAIRILQRKHDRQGRVTIRKITTQMELSKKVVKLGITQRGIS